MEQVNVTPEKKGRPGLLVALCICTFIWSGIMAIFSLIGIIASGMFADLFREYLGGAAAVIGGYIAIIMAVSFIFWFLSLFGAIKMFKLKKSGFVFYVIPNCLMLIIQIALIYFMPSAHWIVYLYTFVSVLFIVLYAANLKRMT
jgi:hypothetical protein